MKNKDKIKKALHEYIDNMSEVELAVAVETSISGITFEGQELDWEEMSSSLGKRNIDEFTLKVDNVLKKMKVNPEALKEQLEYLNEESEEEFKVNGFLGTSFENK